MSEIVMQFAGSSSLTSRLIQWFGHGKFAHVDTVMPDGTLLGARNDVMAGYPAGVQIRGANYQQGYVTKKVAIPCTDVQQKAYYDFVLDQVGKPYDNKAIIAFATGTDWSDRNAWFCSELNTAALQACGWLKQLADPPNKIDPDSLLLVLSAFVDV
jgi:uncharacterized protein YycO